MQWKDQVPMDLSNLGVNNWRNFAKEITIDEVFWTRSEPTSGCSTINEVKEMLIKGNTG